MKQIRWKKILLVSFILFLIIFVLPTIILGELIYSASRSQGYQNLQGMDEIRLTTSDNVEITIWAEKVTTNRSVLLVHGHFDHSQLIEERYASIFRDLSYNIVTIDLRNHGRSEHAPPVTMGIDEKSDVIAALQWMETKWDEIILFGTSMGAIAALLAYNEINIARSLILDSAFHDPIEVMNKNFEKNYIIQPWRFMVVQYLTQLRFSRDFPDVLNILDSLEIPTLVAHGSKDVEASPSFLLEVDDLNNSNIDTQLVKDGEHSRLHQHEQFIIAVTTLLEG